MKHDEHDVFAVYLLYDIIKLLYTFKYTRTVTTNERFFLKRERPILNKKKKKEIGIARFDFSRHKNNHYHHHHRERKEKKRVYNICKSNNI